MTIIRTVSMPQLSPVVVNPTPLLTVTGASLREAKNSHVELQKISETTLASKDAAYADLAKKACEAIFKNKDFAGSIASDHGPDARYLQEIAINLFLLKDMPGADVKKIATLQSRLNSLGATYCKNVQKHASVGDLIPVIIAHHNSKNGHPYGLQLMLTRDVDAFVKSVPNAHDLARGMIHRDYLKEGLVGSYQNFHDFAVDQASADQISQQGNGSSPANSTLAKQFLSAKLAGTSQSLTDTVLVALSQLDLQRESAAPHGSKKGNRVQSESLSDANVDRRGNGDVKVNVTTGPVTQTVDLNGVGEAMLAQGQNVDKLLDMLRHQPVREVLRTCQNSGVGDDSIGGETHSIGIGTRSSSTTGTTSDSNEIDSQKRQAFIATMATGAARSQDSFDSLNGQEIVVNGLLTTASGAVQVSTHRSIEHVESQVLAEAPGTFKPVVTKLSEGIGQTLDRTGLPNLGQENFLGERTITDALGPVLLEGQLGLGSSADRPSTKYVTGSSSAIRNVKAGSDSSDFNSELVAAMQKSLDRRQAAYTDTGEIIATGKQLAVSGTEKLSVQERIDYVEDGEVVQGALTLEALESFVSARTTEREAHLPPEELLPIQSRKFNTPVEHQALRAELNAAVAVAHTSAGLSPVSGPFAGSTQGVSSDSIVSFASDSDLVQKLPEEDISQANKQETLLGRIRKLRVLVGGKNPVPLKPRLEDRLLKIEKDRSEEAVVDAKLVGIDERE